MPTRGQLFNGEMVRAIRRGAKTETRRPITRANSDKVEFWSSHLGNCGGFGGFDDLDWSAHRVDCNPRPHGTPCTARCNSREHCGMFVDGDAFLGGEYIHVPGIGGETRQRVRSRTSPGDNLYVRETHAPAYGPGGSTMYRADWDRPYFVPQPKWTPSIHMPKDLARINLRVTSVHAEQIQEITHAGALAEGIEPDEQGFNARVPFARLWDSIYAGRGLGWAANAWCWVVKFEVTP